MRNYPYACLEQQASKAIASGNGQAWAALVENLPTYLDGDGLAAFYPGMRHGDIALTAYLLAISDASGRTLPVEARARMLKALGAFVDGRLAGERAGSGNLRLRLAALHALARAGEATPGRLATVDPKPAEWPVAAIADWIEVLKRQPPGREREEALQAASESLKQRFNRRGRLLALSEAGREPAWWMMNSADTSAVRALLAVQDVPAWKPDMAALAEGVLARQDRGRWDTTTANAWGLLAMQGYARRFEARAPQGVTRLDLDGTPGQVDWSRHPTGSGVQFALNGASQALAVDHAGAGAPYLTTLVTAAVPLQAPREQGYRLQRQLIPVAQAEPGRWHVGDVVRVKLDVEARDDLGWVVIDDPVPAGASVLGGGLRRDSALLTAGESRTGWAWPVWEERRFDRFLAYYERVPRGTFSLEYTLRLNTPGRFQLPASRIEAMYAPEVFAEQPNREFVVLP